MVANLKERNVKVLQMKRKGKRDIPYQKGGMRSAFGQRRVGKEFRNISNNVPKRGLCSLPWKLPER